MVDPTGVPAVTEIKIPTREQQTEHMAEQIVTERKLLNNRMAERAGNITNAEISRDPTRFIASTIIMAMTTAISKLYALEFVPVAFANFSSKVTANIL